MFLFPPDVRRAFIKVRGREPRTVMLGAVQPGELEGIDFPLPFLVNGYKGRVCIQKVRGMDAGGAVVSTLGRQPCV